MPAGWEMVSSPAYWPRFLAAAQKSPPLVVLFHGISPTKAPNAGSRPPTGFAAIKLMRQLSRPSARSGGAEGEQDVCGNDQQKFTSNCHLGIVAGAHSSGCPAHPPACLALPPGPCVGTAPGSTPCAQSSSRGSP